jgi:hypothetical protein
MKTLRASSKAHLPLICLVILRAWFIKVTMLICITRKLSLHHKTYYLNFDIKSTEASGDSTRHRKPNRLHEFIGIFLFTCTTGCARHQDSVCVNDEVLAENSMATLLRLSRIFRSTRSIILEGTRSFLPSIFIVSEERP